MKNQFSAAFYSNKNGEIFAFVSDFTSGRRHKLIKNIESFRYTSDMLLEEAKSGFESFSYYDVWDYNGVDFAAMEESIIFDNELYYIGCISEKGSFLNYSKMSAPVYRLFASASVSKVSA